MWDRPSDVYSSGGVTTNQSKAKAYDDMKAKSEINMRDSLVGKLMEKTANEPTGFGLTKGELASVIGITPLDVEKMPREEIARVVAGVQASINTQRQNNYENEAAMNRFSDVNSTQAYGPVFGEVR